MRKFIKIIALLLIATICISPLCIISHADGELSGNEGQTAESSDCCGNYDLEELRSKFTVSEYEGEEYAWYSPVKDENDTTKYPVFIFLHGVGHETTYLTKSFIPYYASEYLQAQFNNGGAHIVLPQMWHLTTSSEQVNELIRSYIAANESNINMDEIILVGASMGARKAYRIAVSNPGYYSSVMLICPAIWFKADELKEIADTPVWLVSSKRDILTGNHKKSWSILLEATNVPENCRWTYFDGNVYSPDGKFQLSHFLAKYAGCDGYMLDGKSYLETYSHVSLTDGNGNDSPSGIIDWANANTVKTFE